MSVFWAMDNNSLVIFTGLLIKQQKVKSILSTNRGLYQHYLAPRSMRRLHRSASCTAGRPTLANTTILQQLVSQLCSGHVVIQRLLTNRKSRSWPSASLTSRLLLVLMAVSFTAFRTLSSLSTSVGWRGVQGRCSLCDC